MKVARPMAAGIALIASIVFAVAVSLISFSGGFESTVPVTLRSERAGLVMEPDAKVKIDGVVVGRVGRIDQSSDSAILHLNIDESAIGLIPANVTGQIKATTVFGAKYVEFDLPDDPSSQRLVRGAVVMSTNVTTEVNSVFENISNIMAAIEPDKLNATLGAIAEGLRGRGADLGITLDDANVILERVNVRSETLTRDLQNTGGASNILADSADSILSIIDNATVTSQTVVEKRTDVDRILLSAIGLGNEGAEFLGSNNAALQDTLRLLVPTTALLNKYEPVLRCVPRETVKDYHRVSGFAGTNTGYSLDLDVGLVLGDDAYKYPENLPINAAKGGPYGQPGCYPTPTREIGIVPYQVMNTGAMLNGFGTYTPRLGNPPFVDYLFGDITSIRSGQ